MKKKLLALGLAAVMTIGGINITAFADELPKLDAPTDLTWGRRYSFNGKGEYYNYPGMISCKQDGLYQGRMLINIYKKPDLTPIRKYDMMYSFNKSADYYNSSKDFIRGDGLSGSYEDGEYYFTMQSKGDGVNYADSDIVTSETWTYKRPDYQLPAADKPRWNWPDLIFEPLADESLVGHYEIQYFFSKNESDAPASAGYHTGHDYIQGLTRTFSIPDGILSTKGAGYYYFRVRACTADMTRAQNGPWSEMSEAYCLTETVLNIDTALTEILQNEKDPENIRARVQNLDTRELKEAMLADNRDTDTVKKMGDLEKKLGELNISVNDSMTDRFPADGVSITGALLNNVNSDSVTFNIGEPKDEHDINPALYNDTVAINFSMDLDGVANPDNLEVPVKITLPVPANINPDFLVILHYPLKGGAPEKIDHPYCFEKDGKWYTSFVLNHFSDFVMTETVPPAYKAGDVNDDGDVDAKDKATLNRYLAGWDGYKEKILSWDAADIDGDGKVTAKDKAILNRYLAGWTGYGEYFN